MVRGSVPRASRVAINGLGRIGRAFLKLALTRPELDLVAVNDLADPENLVYLMEFDSVYGRYDRAVAVESNGDLRLRVGDRIIRYLRQKDPAQLP